MYANNELLFPPHVTSRLRQSRGEDWRALIDRITSLEQDHPEHLAFSLLMIRLNGCLKCETDSYRAMRGCTACSHQTLRRCKESDRKLFERYDVALEDMCAHLGVEAAEHVLQRAPSAKAA
jgi:hypothetical protein